MRVSPNSPNVVPGEVFFTVDLRADGTPRALAEVERLERDGGLGGYQYLPAVKADLLARLGRDAEAAAAYRRALELTANEAERAFLAGRLAALGSSGARAE